MNRISVADILVERILPCNKGNLKAFCAVRLPNGMKINSCRIIQQPGQCAWVSLPQNEWTDSEGNKHYSPIIELPTELKEAIALAVLAAWAAANKGGRQ